MRIALVSAALPPLSCGEAASTWFLGRELAGRGHEVHVVTTRRPAPIQAPPATTLHDVMEAWTWRQAPRLLARLRRISPDAVLLNYMGAMYAHHPMITFAPTFVRKTLPGARFVTRFEHVTGGALPHDLHLSAYLARVLATRIAGARGVDASLGTLLRDSHALIALSELHRKRLEDVAEGAAGRITVVPPAPNVEVVADGDEEAARRRGRARVGAAASDFLIGFFGYVYPDKGIETLLEAVAKLRERRTETRLLVLGGRTGTPGSEFFAYYDRMRELARALSLEDAVTWVGGFAHGDPAVPDLFRAADVWALPFVHGATLNNSSLTSLASYGRPVVTTSAPMAEPAFVDGENVRLVPARDALALANALQELADDRALRERLASGAARLARERLSWADCAARTLSLLSGGSEAASVRARTRAGSTSASARR